MGSRRRWLPTVLLGAHCLAHSVVVAADPLPVRAEQVADYRISVTLDAPAKRLAGRARVTWRNPSSTDTVGELWLHLYLNAFRNTQSTFFRETGGQLRRTNMPEDGWGWIDVTSIALADGTDLKPSLRFEAPDDGNRDDRTLARVTLPRPVAPGESIAFDVQFTAQLPQVFARTGYVRDYFLVAQWFPKLAVYEPAGRRGRAAGGWNRHQFHGRSEFYADFGHYRVDITLPTRFIVGATGQRVDRRDHGDGTTTHVYEQGDVHDFAWTASPEFVEVRRRFVAANEVTAAEYAEAARLLDRSLEDLRLSDVELILLMQPSHLPQLERHVRAALLAIKWYGLWYGRYPHRTLTIVDPAPGAGGSAGMEYPTFITAGTSARFNRWPFDRLRLPEEVVVHEYAHQYWQGMIASNEFEEAWLDEGITTYAAARVMELGYGRETSMASFLGLRLGERDVLRFGNTPNAGLHAIRQPPWTYASDDAYGLNSYTRPALLLRTIEQLIGPQPMARLMRTYAERWRFRHPSTEDFYAVADEVAGPGVRPLLSQVIDRGAVLDYEVAEAMSELAMPPAGYLDDAKAASAPANDAKPANAPQGATLVPEADAIARQEAGEHIPYDTRVIVQRRGEAVLPVEIAFKFEGKPPERVTWDGQARWRAFTFHRPERLEWVDIDPDRRLELDTDWLNNTRRLTPDRRAAVRLTSRWTFLLQQVLAALGL